ncbi:unnamed protein product [Prorocentrum cordatum]|uniref:glucan 1,3-beta-glucosidase n=1 Tax=Prorocentrum cordatum TaxID=2364126 RepID=A0ABN9XSX6_9DINO|nr:unnamed protein product [Polarella glacialis]
MHWRLLRVWPSLRRFPVRRQSFGRHRNIRRATTQESTQSLNLAEAVDKQTRCTPPSSAAADFGDSVPQRVANEPSAGCDMAALCDWYEEAIGAIRAAGMDAGQACVVLPIYWYDRLEEFLRVWVPRGNFLRYENVVLDFHFYHCFGSAFPCHLPPAACPLPGVADLPHPQSEDAVRHTSRRGIFRVRTNVGHGRILRALPGAVVGEWSLARPPHVLATDEMELQFAEAQVDAYAAASHGWFFWTYSDQSDHWDFRTGDAFDPPKLSEP